jgi:peptidoglycan hydrolase-like amidase
MKYLLSLVHMKLKQKLFYILLLLLVPITLFSYFSPVKSEIDCNSSNLSPSDMDICISRISATIAAYMPAQEKNKQDLADLRTQLDSITKKITNIQNQLKKAENDIKIREGDLAYAKEIFDQKAVNQYMSIRLYDPLLPFLTSANATTAFREIALRQRAADEDRKVMEQYATDLSKLKSDKETLQKNQSSLASLQKQVTEKEKFLASEVAKVDSYIATLSARQNELSALKAGGFSTTVGDTPTTMEPCSGKPGSGNFCDPGFRPAFAAFSYGAPHRKGMSQYGAYGRAKAGKSAEDILHAYYGGIEIKKDYSTDININVSGYGSVNIETYVKRIYEMPGSWTDNDSAALKAQAVAARSYALAYTNNGANPICATESCQVYKPSNKGGAWDAAVDATRGWVLVSGGKPFSAWYASTAGGYTFSYAASGYSTPNLWDNPSGNQGGWQSNSYEILGGSPWFYKGWYKSRSGDSCGKGNPWLTSEEMADILNASKVLTDGGGDVSRVSPISSCWGGNPYSISDLQSIGGYTSVSSVSVVYGNDGSTLSVRFGTNKGDISLNGADIKKAFNLRAPGYIGIKSTLFNIEKL